MTWSDIFEWLFWAAIGVAAVFAVAGIVGAVVFARQLKASDVADTSEQSSYSARDLQRRGPL